MTTEATRVTGSCEGHCPLYQDHACPTVREWRAMALARGVTPGELYSDLVASSRTLAGSSPSALDSSRR